MRHIAVLSPMVDAPDFALRHPDDGAKLAAGLRPLQPDWRFSTHKVAEGEWPHDLGAIDALVITGSVASVNDDRPWIASLEDLVRRWHAQGGPMVGICFGHQIIHKALGGQVVASPTGLRVGTVTTALAAQASGLPWMQPEAPRVTLFAAHEDQVLVPAPGALVLGGDAACPIGCSAIGDNVFTTQCHPEFSPGFMAELLPAVRDELSPAAYARGLAQIGQPVDAPLMLGWIARFLAQAFSRPAA